MICSLGRKRRRLDFPIVDRALDGGLDLTAGFLGLENERRIVNLGAGIRERVEHRVRQHFEMRQALLRGEQLAAVSRASPAKSVKLAFTRSTLVWIMLVEWAMPSV